MLRKSKYLIGFIGLVLAVSFGFSLRASALSGIGLSPFEQQINLQPTDTKKTFNLKVTNYTNNLKEIDLSVEDFGSLNNTGGVLLEGSNSYTQRYGLASWISLGTDTVILNANQSAAIPITIDNRADLQPGGHYGALIASVNSTVNGQTNNQVSVNQQLLSLVIADKVGGEHFALKLTKIDQNGNWLHLPSTVELQFQNPGNVQVTPRGIVNLESPSGKILAKGIINPSSAFILSSSYYDMYVPLVKVGSALPLPGLYKIVVHYRYDQVSNYAVKSAFINFIDLGMYLLIILLVIILIIIYKKTNWIRLPKKAKKTDQKVKP